jgi:SAM-dependent methyltransferase
VHPSETHPSETHRSELTAPSEAAASAPSNHPTPLRIARSAGDWVSFQLHRETLERFVPHRSRVLEVNAGVGHYTEALHHLGCKINVLDESLDELDSHQARARARGFASSIEAWVQGGFGALAGFPDGAFDAVVGYGGALSHALDRRDRALSECMRVLRPRGVLVLDVFSLWGIMRRNLTQMLARDLVQNRAIIRSGNAPEALVGIERRPPERATPVAAFHEQPLQAQPTDRATPAAAEPASRERHCHLFRAAELEAFLRRAGLDVLSLSASSALSTGVELPMPTDAGAWSALLEYERAACSERGYLDSGHQLIAVARR